MNSDLEIAHTVSLKPLDKIIKKLNIPDRYVIPYGKYIAKVQSSYLDKLKKRPDGKLILVTSITPTEQGEGKTTITIGIAQSIARLGHKVSACIRQPSLGPFFGIKGGATGSGYSQVLPSDDILLHFTGDDHAVISAHNLISSIIDNHIYHGNKLSIDKNRIFWNRVSGINDRALRNVKVGIGKNMIERTEGFHISSASEIMSILCLSKDIEDVKERIGNILLAVDSSGNPITPKSLHIQGAASSLLRSAIHPNLVQSLEGVPVFIHGGPFGNISIGCSSVIASKMALKLSDYVVTEAGFATDLGAEKFFNIVCRLGSIEPSAVIIVATIKALKMHGSQGSFSGKPDITAVINGMENLERHIDNIQRFGLPPLVVINRFADDREDELNEAVQFIRNKLGVQAFITDVRNSGARGGAAAAKGILEICKYKNSFRYLYDTDSGIKEKIEIIAKEIYGADRVSYSDDAIKDISATKQWGYDKLPVCIAKTHKSLSDNPILLGRPKGFDITVHRVAPAAGAGFIVVMCGNILLMPGLPVNPLAERIDIDKNGRLHFV